MYFAPNELPPQLLADLEQSRVVMLGEHHGYREHHDFLLEVVRAVHRRGGRLLLLEGFDAESWLADAYVRGKVEALSPATAKHFGYTLDALRAFNLGRPEAERVRVAMIDIDHRAAALPLALARMLPHLEARSCIETFLARASWDARRPLDAAQASFEKARTADPDQHLRRLESLRASLADGSCQVGSREQETVAAMVAVAVESLRIRAVWERDGEHAAHPAREEAMKKLVDRRLSTTDGPVVINVGG